MTTEMIGRAHVDEANGTSIAWGEMGEGEPLVLIHGFQQSHRTRRRAAPLLAADFRLLMPDLPGHGLSGRLDAPYTLTSYAGSGHFPHLDVPDAFASDLGAFLTDPDRPNASAPDGEGALVRGRAPES
jgi:pimeloyl-ACP methyl ester carboxylesterase